MAPSLVDCHNTYCHASVALILVFHGHDKGVVLSVSRLLADILLVTEMLQTECLCPAPLINPIYNVGVEARSCENLGAPRLEVQGIAI